ncbi:hypothetical protein ACVWXO_003073 [Bradyrhizobium sp. LM2.7]
MQKIRLPMKPVVPRNERMNPDQNFMLFLREALEASWDRQTDYGASEKAGNPTLGQCYPTSRVELSPKVGDGFSRVVQHYYPATEIIKGKV